MVYIEVGKNNIISKMHRNPLDPKVGLQTPRDELEKTGYFVDEVPEPEMIDGKYAIPKFNADTKKVFYEYANVPMSDTERINNLESVINELLMAGNL